MSQGLEQSRALPGKEVIQAKFVVIRAGVVVRVYFVAFERRLGGGRVTGSLARSLFWMSQLTQKGDDSGRSKC